jgi:hypothetical protein
MKKGSLVQVCLAQLHGSKTSYMGKDRDSLIDLLVQHQQNPQIPLLQQAAAALHHPPSPALSEILMREGISGAFLHPMEGIYELALIMRSHFFTISFLRVKNQMSSFLMKIVILYAFRSMRYINWGWYEKQEERSASRHLLMPLVLLKWMGETLG